MPNLKTKIKNLNQKYDHDFEITWHNGALSPYGFSSFMGYVPKSKTSLVILSNHEQGVSQVTDAGIQILEWIHNVRDQLSSLSVHWTGYLIACFLALMLGILPVRIYQYIRLMSKGHPKGEAKALLSLSSQVLYTPVLILMIWGGPFLGAIIYILFTILICIGLWQKFEHFAGAHLHIKPIRIFTESLIIIGLYWLDFLLALYMTLALMVLIMTYIKRMQNYVLHPHLAIDV